MKEISFNFTSNTRAGKADSSVSLLTSDLLKKASIHSQFSLEELKNTYSGSLSWTAEEEKLLIKSSTSPNSKGRHSMHDYERNLIFRSLGANGIRKLLSELPAEKLDNTQSLLLGYVNGKAPDLRQQNLQQLVATHNISGWLQGTGITVPAGGDIMYRIRQQESLRPFEILTYNFRGRSGDLAALSDYVDWRPKSTFLKSVSGWFRDIIKWHDKAPLMITGIGGVGKSTLIAKFILDQLHYNKDKKIPFIYFDFDKPGLSLSNPVELAIDALRQLSIQFPGSASIFSSIGDQLQTEYFEKEETNNISFTRQSRGSDRQVLYERYTEQYHKEIESIDSPVLVVFDSFEELQYRATSSELHTIFSFIREIAEFIPRLRPVFVGRSDINYGGITFEKIKLEGFDSASASAFLMVRGIPDESLAQAIFKKVGGNPLTLLMIAEIVKKENISTAEEIEAITGKMDKAILQELLVKRNLEHIHDRDTARIAVPGILVRKITPELIRKVLAEPCGFTNMSEEKATEIFQELKKESFLVIDSGSGISFRQDLRIALNSLIMNNPEYRGRDIHDKAIEFYKDKTDPECRAEYLYHALMRGDDPATINNVYDSSVRPYIENSMPELTGNANTYLSRLMGITASDDKVNEADLREWEQYQKAEIIDLMQYGDEASLQNMDKTLGTRPERSPDSCLYYYEAKVALKLANYKKTNAILDKALLETSTDNNRQRIDLLLLRADMYEYQMDFINAFSCLSQLPVLDAAYSYVMSNDINMPAIINGRLSVARLARRIGMEQFNNVINAILKFIGPYEEKIFSVLRELTEKNSITSLLPFPYKTYVEKLYNNTGIVNFRELFVEMDSTFSDAKTFSKLHQELRSPIKTKTDLERDLESRYNLNLKDICEPGVLEINLVDVARFREMADKRQKDFTAKKK